MAATAVLEREHTREKKEKSSERDKGRLNVVLSPRSMDRLEALKIKTDASTYTEVFKNALRLYDALIEEIENGTDLYIKDKEGNFIAYKIFN